MSFSPKKVISCDQAFLQSKSAGTRPFAASPLNFKTLSSKGFRP